MCTLHIALHRMKRFFGGFGGSKRKAAAANPPPPPPPPPAPAPPLSQEEACSPEAQKALLLAAGIHGQAGWGWGPAVPLAEFEGVTVNSEGLVVGLDFSEQEELEFDLAVFAPLTSLQVINFKNCETATGECSSNLRGRQASWLGF